VLVDIRPYREILIVAKDNEFGGKNVTALMNNNETLTFGSIIYPLC
jgi:hypothetical protein